MAVNRGTSLAHLQVGVDKVLSTGSPALETGTFAVTTLSTKVQIAPGIYRLSLASTLSTSGIIVHIKLTTANTVDATSNPQFAIALAALGGEDRVIQISHPTNGTTLFLDIVSKTALGAGVWSLSAY